MNFEKQPMEHYDVAILGGGLAGLTLGLQLKQARPGTSIFIAEKRPGLAPEAAFKVGESTQSIACNYFGEVLGLTDHLIKDQVEKCGLRFWSPAGDNSSLAQRVELGPSDYPSVPTWQFDRGRFENFLGDKNHEIGNDLFSGSFITNVEVGRPHKVTIIRGGPGGQESTVTARWLVDASGRSFLLKKKLGLLEQNGHNVNSAWFRLAGGLDLEDWVDPGDNEFFDRMNKRGIRRYSTNHMCGEGYWLWLIQLSSGPISIGICADPKYHPLDEMNTLEKALDWIGRHEPQLAQSLAERRDQVEDFLKVEDFSYGCKQCFSGPDRWCLVGEAGAFLDPFYSPGSDFISLANTFTTDLVTRELWGEDVDERAMAHDSFYLDVYRGNLTQYEDQYSYFGNPLLMSLKVPVNNIVYWGMLSLLFFHRKLTDLELMAAVRPDADRLLAAQGRIERLFHEWHRLENDPWVRGFAGPKGFPAWGERQRDLVAGLDDEQLAAQLKWNADLMEGVAVLLFTRAAQNLGDAAPGEDVKINPYAIGLDPARWEADGLFDGTGMTAAEARQTPAAGIKAMFAEEFATLASDAGEPTLAVAAASGAAEELRLDVVAGAAAGFTILLTDEILFGRESGGAGRLGDDPKLSRAHARIARNGTGNFVIADLSSTNGTVVNGTRVEGPVVLAAGDKIELGATTLAVVYAPVAVQASDAGKTVVSRIPEALGSAAPGSAD